MSVKDYLIRMMSVKSLIPETTIEAVVNHQFTSLIEAMQENDSLEISGFGKFLFKYPSAYKRLAELIKKKNQMMGTITKHQHRHTEKLKKQYELKRSIIDTQLDRLTTRLKRHEEEFSI